MFNLSSIRIDASVSLAKLPAVEFVGSFILGFWMQDFTRVGREGLGVCGSGEGEGSGDGGCGGRTVAMGFGLNLISTQGSCVGC